MRAHLVASIIALAAAAAVVSGCAQAREPVGDPADPAPAPDATGLTGVWRVSGISGDVDTWLILGGRSLELWRECGQVSGEWVARDGAFLAGTSGWSGACPGDDDLPTVAWLQTASAYERDGAEWLLRRDDGTEVARLTPDADPRPRVRGILPPGDETALLRVAAPETSVELASGDDLVGRWVPIGTFATVPELRVVADGTWSASDGCNGMQGRWASPGPGVLLSTGGPMTLIGCDGSSEPMAFGEARTVGFDGDALLLFDHTGAQVARLIPG